MAIGSISVNVHDNTITESTVTGVVVSSSQSDSDENAEILRELQSVRKQLETTEPMIADALATLEKAVKAKNEPKISECLRKFSGETVKAVLAGVASKALLSWMGIA